MFILYVHGATSLVLLTIFNSHFLKFYLWNYNWIELNYINTCVENLHPFHCKRNIFLKTVFFKFKFLFISTIFLKKHRRWVIHKHKDVNNYILTHNNSFIKTWLSQFLGRLMQSINEKWQMTSKSIMNLWFRSCVNWKIASNIIK